MLCFGLDCVISESFKDRTILHLGIIVYGHFHNSFVKFHSKTIWEPQHDPVISKSLLQ